MVRWMVLGIALFAATTTAGAVDVAVLTHGDEVRLEDHLVPGKLVLVDFYADWCGPCRMLTPRLERLAAEHPEELVLRKVDIVQWNSPVARQYRIGAVPHLRLYDTDGQMLADGDAGRVLAMLEQRLGSSTGGAVDAGPDGAGWVPLAALLAVVAVAAVVLLRRSSSPRERALPGPSAGPPSVVEGEARGAIWFAMIQGSLEGPFSPEQLGDLVSRKVIGVEARVRRRGESGWKELREVIGS